MLFSHNINDWESALLVQADNSRLCHPDQLTSQLTCSFLASLLLLPCHCYYCCYHHCPAPLLAAASVAHEGAQSLQHPPWALFLWSPRGVCYSFPVMSVYQITVRGMNKLTPNLGHAKISCMPCLCSAKILFSFQSCLTFFCTLHFLVFHNVCCVHDHVVNFGMKTNVQP